MTNSDAQNIMMVKSIRYFTILISCILPISFILAHKFEIEALWPWILANAITFTCLILVLIRIRMTTTIASIMYFAITLPVFFAASITTHELTFKTFNAPLFSGYRAMAIVIALVAPNPAWVGTVLISMALVIPPLQALTFSPHILSQPHGAEPWITMAYAIIGMVILKYRIEAQKAQMEIIELRAQEKNFQDFSEIVLALRDLTNTPLQSLVLLVELLNNDQVTTKQASKLLSKTSLKLHELSTLLNEVQKRIPEFENKTSLDSIEVLRGKLNVKKQQDPQNHLQH